jgi:Xaa-Pro aminopeptidase
MQPAKLLYENGPDWQYATGTPIADPALFYQSPTGKTHILVSELEISLMQKSAKVNKIHSFGDVRTWLKNKPLSLASMVEFLIAQEKSPPQTILIPGHFPSALLEKLRAAGLPLQVETAPLFFPRRALKTAAEIKALKAAQQVNEGAFKHAFAILHAAKIRKADSVLLWHNKPLTAEILRGEMNSYLARMGCTEFHGGPIVACGPQGAMPHHRGSGPLKAHQFIVIDCFPRHANGYWGDLTRTVLKGTPTAWHKKVYAAVLGSQKIALSMLKPGADGHQIHQAVVNHLTKAGFPTGADKAGTPYGMFHGTGHGVGLELHDPGPRTLSGTQCILQPGMVTSVEPGLYYGSKATTGGIGGCRIEDVVTLTKTGMQNLTTLSKTNWVIK